MPDTSCTVCGQQILDREESRRNLVGTVHLACPTADLVDAVARWAVAPSRVQPDVWAEVVLAVDELEHTRHLVGIAAQAVETVALQRAAADARNAKADWRARGQTDRTDRNWRDARTELAATAAGTAVLQ